MSGSGPVSLVDHPSPPRGGDAVHVGTRGARVTWHLVTCEFPPRVGGVADFSRILAKALAATSTVHVWAPAPATDEIGATIVHQLPGGFALTRLASLNRALDSYAAPRRLFVQWVPHGYGYKSLNLPFCLWVRHRSRRGDDVHLMVHEPFLPFDLRRIRQNVGALVHRVMLRILLGAASRVWVSTPSFDDDVRGVAPRAMTTTWLPVPSPVPRVVAPDAVRRLRTELAGRAPVVGHFGTCHALIEPLLSRVFEQLAAARPDLRFVLAGRDSDAFAARLVASGRMPGDAIVASGERSADEVSRLIQCCDVFVQPYHDGVSTRRTTLMALLEHGAAIVTAAGPRTEALWTSSNALVLRPQNDALALTTAVLELIDDPSKRERLCARARALYQSEFDVPHLLRALTPGVPA
jgi:glycosyltransferase involved in cell wall biosynthesis